MKIGQRWPENEMRECKVISNRTLIKEFVKLKICLTTRKAGINTFAVFDNLSNNDYDISLKQNANRILFKMNVKSTKTLFLKRLMMYKKTIIILEIYAHNLPLISLEIVGILFFVLKTKCIPKNANVPAIMMPQFLSPRWGSLFGYYSILYGGFTPAYMLSALRAYFSKETQSCLKIIGEFLK